MKKVYAASMALVVAMTAYAAPYQRTEKVESMAQMNLSEMTVKAVPQAQAAAPKAINTIDDLCGLKKWSCEGHLNGAGKNGPREQAVMFNKADETTVLVSDFPWAGKQTKMLVNIASKTVTVMNNQQVGENGAGGDMVYLYTYESVQNGDEANLVSRQSVAGVIEDDGTVRFPADVVFGASDPANEPSGAYYYLDSNNVFTALPYNTPVLSEYESLGTTDYRDGWFNTLIEVDGYEPIISNGVEVLRNKTNTNLITLKNPYANTEWNELGLVNDREGYILINVEHRDWLQVVPLVDCGLRVDYEDGTSNRYFPFNQEGYMVWSGDDWESQKADWEIFEEPVSNVDEDGNVVIYHLYFGVAEAPASPYWWSNVPDTFVPVTSFKLPAGWAGIEGVASDMVEGPVKYYNMQGVEVAAPVKGQLVIKTQGDKATKFIAR